MPSLSSLLRISGSLSNIDLNQESDVMSEHIAVVSWKRNGQKFVDGKYSRGHVWKFDGGAEIPASPSPHVVPAPMSIEEYVDPEEAFVASLSSCHMLFFLHLAGRAKLVVDEYVDEAVFAV